MRPTNIMEAIEQVIREGCNEPYCARNPFYAGTYEARRGALCGRCEDEQIEDDRARNTVPMGDYPPFELEGHWEDA